MARVEPPYAADERAMLVSFLDYYRETMVLMLEGLDEEQARWTPAPTANSLLGLILHLAGVEEWWFHQCFAGNASDFPRWGDPDDRDYELKPAPEHTIGYAIDLYRTNWLRANEIAAAADLDAVGAHPRAQERGTTLRWILVHMIEETARHAGHADITREMIDGKTGI